MNLSKEIWDNLLRLKTEYQNTDLAIETYFGLSDKIKLHIVKEEYNLELTIQANDDSNIKLVKQISQNFTLTFIGFISIDIINAFCIYLPIIFGPLLSKNNIFAFAHFAQSIDGKISAINGNSKWIGNKENQKHAHRLRALTDAILIGANTLRNDKPKLNVRLVDGEDPVRVIIADQNEDIDSLIKASRKKIILICDKIETSQIKEQIEQIELARKDGIFDPAEIIKELSNRGIRRVFIEGGALTLQNFFYANVIDYIQGHIAPIIFGNGSSPFDSNKHELQEVNEANKVLYPIYTPIGDAIMYSGFLK